MLVSLSLALVVLLLSLGNWVLGLLTFGCIGGTTASALGLMSLYGWEFGVMESICVTILVGLAVDYVVHLGHAYSACPDDVVHAAPHRERVARTLFAMEHTGISVLGGALTTVGSSVVLLLCKLTFFVKFGAFMATTSALSFAFSVIFLPAILAELGPESDVGTLRAWRRAYARGKLHRREKLEDRDGDADDDAPHADDDARCDAPPAAAAGASRGAVGAASIAACVAVLAAGIGGAAWECAHGTDVIRAFCPSAAAETGTTTLELSFPSFSVPSDHTTYECRVAITI